MNDDTKAARPWLEGALPRNVRFGEGTHLSSEHAFKRFKSERDPALVVGKRCTLDGVHFALGREGSVVIGDYCCFTNAVLLCEHSLRIGSYVMLGWNVTIADTDFHPLDPALRIEDAIACSPDPHGRKRPQIATAEVIIEDLVFVGANATILKGVRIGEAAWIEPGSVVTKDVPKGARVLGNPAKIFTAEASP